MRTLVFLVLPACYTIPPFAGPVTGDDASGHVDARPDAPPSTHDEDHDLMFDDVDPCPHIPGPNPDGDQDGVGDACDLDPTSPGDMKLFYAFDAQPDLMKTGFSTQNLFDTYELGANAADAYLSPAITFGSARIDIGFTILTSVDSVMSEIGLNTGAADFRNDAYGCFIAYDPASAQLLARDPSTTRGQKVVGAPLAALDGTLSVTRIVGGTFTCTLTVTSQPAQTITFTPAGSEHGYVSVKAAYVNLRLRYLYIVGRP